MSEPLFKEGDTVTVKAKVLEVDTGDNTYHLAFCSQGSETLWVTFDTVEGNYPELRAKQLKAKIEALTKELEELTNEK